MFCSLQVPKVLDMEQEWPKTKPYIISYLQKLYSGRNEVMHFLLYLYTGGLCRFPVMNFAQRINDPVNFKCKEKDQKHNF